MTPRNVPPTLPPLKIAKNLSESIANFDAIVTWAISAPGGIGYFVAAVS
jgi:hypothetical protein